MDATIRRHRREDSALFLVDIRPTAYGFPELFNISVIFLQIRDSNTAMLTNSR